MKTLFLVLLLALVHHLSLADNSVTCYGVTNGQSGTIARGCVTITIAMSGFTGTIGNANFANTNHTYNLTAVEEGKRLSALSYTKTAGANPLFICEVR